MAKGWTGSSEAHARAGAVGGRVVRARYGNEYLAEIGAKGGEKISRDREHMREIGRKGGNAVALKYGKEHFKKLGALGGNARSETRE